MSYIAANALVQTCINGVVKKEAAAVLTNMGLTVSEPVRLLLVRVAHDKALPFEPLSAEFPDMRLHNHVRTAVQKSAMVAACYFSPLLA